MSARHHYFTIFPWILDKLSWKTSVLLESEIFRLFLNTLTPDDKYSRRNIQIFWLQMQAPLSQKGKTFCPFLNVFLNLEWSLKRSENQEEYPSLIMNEIIASETDVFLSV